MSEELADYIKDVEWSEFERSENGDIHVIAPSRERIKYSLRVGTHMGQVMKAIITKCQFIRCSRIPEWDYMKELSILIKLDPLNQDGCLYRRYSPNQDREFWTWRPNIPAVGQNQSATQNVPYQVGLGGGGGSFNSPAQLHPSMFPTPPASVHSGGYTTNNTTSQQNVTPGILNTLFGTLWKA